MTQKLTTVAAAAIDRLTERLAYLACCEFYAGSLESLLASLRPAPAAILMFGGFTPSEESESFDSLYLVAQWNLVLISRDVEGGTKANTNTDGGLLQMIEDAVSAIDSYDLGFPWCSSLAITGAIPVPSTTVTSTVYIITMACGVSFEKVP